MIFRTKKRRTNRKNALIDHLLSDLWCMFHQNNIADPANHIIDIVTYIFDCEEHDGLDEEEQDARDADELPDPDGADEEVPRRQKVWTVDDKLQKFSPELHSVCAIRDKL